VYWSFGDFWGVGAGSVQHGSSFWGLLTEATRAAPLHLPTTKTLPCKPAIPSRTST